MFLRRSVRSCNTYFLDLKVVPCDFGPAGNLPLTWKLPLADGPACSTRNGFARLQPRRLCFARIRGCSQRIPALDRLRLCLFDLSLHLLEGLSPSLDNLTLVREEEQEFQRVCY